MNATAPAPHAVHRFTAPVMGTFLSLRVDVPVGDQVPHTDIEQVCSEMLVFLRRVEADYSRFLATSLVSRVNSGLLDVLDAGPEFCSLLDACTWLEHDSGGVFLTRRADGSLDLAGYVKGWAAQHAGRLLDTAGFANWCLSVGGDVATGGCQGNGAPWRVGIVDPSRPGRVAAWLDLPTGFAVATSGSAARGGHIWDGTGRPVDRPGSCTVVGPELAWADAFATVGFALGGDGPGWVSSHPGYAGFLLS